MTKCTNNKVSYWPSSTERAFNDTRYNWRAFHLRNWTMRCPGHACYLVCCLSTMIFVCPAQRGKSPWVEGCASRARRIYIRFVPATRTYCAAVINPKKHRTWVMYERYVLTLLFSVKNETKYMSALHEEQEQRETSPSLYFSY